VSAVAWPQRESQNVAALVESRAMSLASSNGVSPWARAKEPAGKWRASSRGELDRGEGVKLVAQVLAVT
jgi:hypothetical protein